MAEVVKAEVVKWYVCKSTNPVTADVRLRMRSNTRADRRGRLALSRIAKRSTNSFCALP